MWDTPSAKYLMWRSSIRKKLEKVLECSDSMSLLEKMLQQLQEKQINLAKDTESLICKIFEVRKKSSKE